jgi:hypothetical protein
MLKNAIKDELVDALIDVFKNEIKNELIDALICILNNSTDDELINDILSRDVTIHNTEDCGSRVLMIERSQN